MTSISLDAPATGGPLAANLTEENTEVIVGVVNVGDYHQRDFDSEELLYWEDDKSKPKMGKVITGLVVSADPSVVAGSDDDAPALKPGDLTTFWCERGKFFTYRDAVKNAGGIFVGDVMRWQRGVDDPPKKRGHNPKKNHTATIRRPEAKDGDLADRCVAAYHEQAARPALDSVPAAPVRDEEPF